MNIDLKKTIEQGNLSKLERMKLILENVQKFYLDELTKSKDSLQNIERILKQAPDILTGENKNNGIK